MALAVQLVLLVRLEILPVRPVVLPARSGGQRVRCRQQHLRLLNWRACWVRLEQPVRLARLGARLKVSVVLPGMHVRSRAPLDGQRVVLRVCSASSASC